MLTSARRHYNKIHFFTDSVVASCYTTSYYGSGRWSIRRNKNGEYVVFSDGAHRGMYPYIGRLERFYHGSPWGGIRAKKIPESLVKEMLKQAQTGRGKWADRHGVCLAEE